MSAIEFVGPPDKTFSVQLYDDTANTTIGGAVGATESSPGRYHADTSPATGIVYVVATATNFTVVGYANLNYPGGNGRSEVLDNYEQAAALGVTPPLPPAEDIQPGDVRAGVVYLDSNGDTQTGTLVLPEESEVLADVGYGAAGTEFLGELVASVGGTEGETANTVLANGQIQSPLWIGTAYLTQYGKGFVWRVPAVSGLTAAEAVAHFRGRQTCSESLDYAWDVEANSITEVTIGDTVYWDLAFDLTAEQTLLIDEGVYRWWVVVDTVDGEVVLKQYSGYNPLKWLTG